MGGHLQKITSEGIPKRKKSKRKKRKQRKAKRKRKETPGNIESALGPNLASKT